MLAYEERNRKIGFTTSLIIHLLLLIFFLLYKAWPFDPPLAPQIGIMVNFGTSDVGSGDIQNESESGENTEENTEATETEIENAEEVTELTESSESSESESTEVTENTETVEETSEVVESEVESLVETTNSETTSEATTESATTETETEVETEEVNESNVMGGSSSNNNNGNDENEVGDKGDENGEINESNIYQGSHGGGNGASLNMNGWQWDNLPNKKDATSETGKITFKIVIDEDGSIEDVKVVSSSVSIPVQNFYRDLLYREATLKKASNFSGSSSSTGIVVWEIKSK